MTAKDQALSLRKRAYRHGLRIAKRGDTFHLLDGESLLCTGSACDMEHYLDTDTTRRTGRTPGRSHPYYTLSEEWNTAIESWVGWLKLGGLSPKSIRLRYDHVRVVARRSGVQRPGDVTLGVLVKLCSAEDWSREHRRGVRRSLVSFFDFCVSNAIAEANPAAGLPAVRCDTGRPRPATDDVWEHLIANAPPRELLMIRLAGEAGLRRAEVAQCHRDDLRDGPRGSCLIVHGKGQKQRVVPISDSLADAIRQQCASGFVFPGLIDGHLSVGHVGTLISELMSSGYTMHTLRHRFGTRAYRGSRNLRAVQVLLGHSSVATTERYCAVDDDEIRAAMMAAVGD
jgi:integrase